MRQSSFWSYIIFPIIAQVRAVYHVVWDDAHPSFFSSVLIGQFNLHIACRESLMGRWGDNNVLQRALAAPYLSLSKPTRKQTTNWLIKTGRQNI